MTDTKSERGEETEGGEIALEYELDAAPEKVWRAVAIPAFRERWLPEADLAEPEPIASIPGVEIRYRMRDDGAAGKHGHLPHRPRGGRRDCVPGHPPDRGRSARRKRQRQSTPGEPRRLNRGAVAAHPQA